MGPLRRYSRIQAYGYAEANARASIDALLAPENSQRMYSWLMSKGVQNAVLDTTSLTGTHLGSAAYFLLNVITNDLNNW